LIELGGSYYLLRLLLSLVLLHVLIMRGQGSKELRNLRIKGCIYYLAVIVLFVHFRVYVLENASEFLLNPKNSILDFIIIYQIAIRVANVLNVLDHDIETIFILIRSHLNVKHLLKSLKGVKDLLGSELVLGVKRLLFS
jgi:hypothetical protein